MRHKVRDPRTPERRVISAVAADVSCIVGVKRPEDNRSLQMRFAFLFRNPSAAHPVSHGSLTGTRLGVRATCSAKTATELI